MCRKVAMQLKKQTHISFLWQDPQLNDNANARQQGEQLQCQIHHLSAQSQCFSTLLLQAIHSEYPPCTCYIHYNAHTIHHPRLLLSYFYPLLWLYPSPFSSGYLKFRLLPVELHGWQQCCKAQRQLFLLSTRC